MGPNSVKFSGKFWVIEPPFDTVVLFRTSVDTVTWVGEGTYPINLSPVTLVVFLNKLFLYDFEFSNFVASSTTGSGWSETPMTGDVPVSTEGASSTIVDFSGTLCFVQRYLGVMSIYKSSDGIAFTRTSTAGLPSDNATASGVLIFLGGMLLLLPSFSSTSTVYQSVDGVTWSVLLADWATAQPGLHNMANYAFTVLAGKLYIAGSGHSGFINSVYSTADGLNWVQEVYANTWSGRQQSFLSDLGGALLLMGGVNNSGSLLDVWQVQAGVTPPTGIPL